MVPRTQQEDAALIAACERQMREGGWQPDAFFFAHRGGRAQNAELQKVFADYEATDATHSYWQDDAPQTMLIDEVEAIWSAIEERDDWQPLYDKVDALRRMGAAHGPAPQAAAQQR